MSELQSSVFFLKLDTKLILLNILIKLVESQLEVIDVENDILILQGYIERNKVSESVEEEREELIDFEDKKENLINKRDKYLKILKFGQDRLAYCSKDCLVEANKRREEVINKNKNIHAKPPFNQIYWNKQYNNQK